MNERWPSSESLANYPTPMRGDPRLHHEIAWFATDDDRALGILILDKVDRDFGWVVLEKIDGAYHCTDSDVSLPTPEAAERALHEAMLRTKESNQC